MRPESDALHVLSTTRAKAKMHEFRIPLDDHIDLPRNPTILFSLAVGILGDAAAAIADSLLTHEKDGFPAQGNGETAVAWNPGDDSMRDTSLGVLKFAATYFDAFLKSRLEVSITTEFSLLCAASYYLADNPGSGRVVIRNTPTPDPDFGGGLPRLVHAILNDNFTPTGGDHRHPYAIEHLLEALHAFFAMEADAPPIEGLCERLHEQAYDIGSPRELLYADIIAALCRRKLDNASRTLLPEASGLDLAAWQPALQKSHFPWELWPAQKRICDAGLLRGGSAVIQMPTSAGKTRATELIIRSAFLANRASLAPDAQGRVRIAQPGWFQHRGPALAIRRDGHPQDDNRAPACSAVRAARDPSPSARPATRLSISPRVSGCAAMRSGPRHSGTRAGHPCRQRAHCWFCPASSGMGRA